MSTSRKRSRSSEKSFPARCYRAVCRSSCAPEWRPRIQGSYLYRISPFFYWVPGVCFWFFEDENLGVLHVFSAFRGGIISFYFLLQGICSYWADVISFGLDSPAHIPDMLLACFGSWAIGYSVLVEFRLDPVQKYAILLPGFLFGIGCFVGSRKRRAQADVEGFIWMHFLWHCAFPMTCVVFTGYNVWFFGEPEILKSDQYPDFFLCFWVPYIMIVAVVVFSRSLSEIDVGGGGEHHQKSK